MVSSAWKVFEVINNIHTPEGFQKMMSTLLWEGGHVSGTGRAMHFPDFGKYETDESKQGMVFWDLHLTNYSHEFWPHLFKDKGKGKGSGASSSGGGCQGSLGVHPGSS